MAVKASVHRANLKMVDMDRNYYQDHALTLARHPSETDERLMVRILAFALNAREYLEFGQGMTDDDEADLWEKDLTGAIALWIDVGTPDEKLIRKACGRSAQVLVYTYGGRVADMWLEQNAAAFERQDNLTIVNIPVETSRALALLAKKTMDLHCIVQDGQVWISEGDTNVPITLQVVKTARK